MPAGTITHRKKKGFTRDLGWKLTPDGRRIQPRFLLGHDRAMAELADAKLAVLWEKVVEHADARNRHLDFDEEPEPPLWDDLTLSIADAIRKGKASLAVRRPHPDELGGPADDGSYATWIHHLQQEYGHLIALMPEDAEAMRRGQERHLDYAHHRARQARRNASIARAPIPATGIHQTLYEAIEAYAKHAEHAKAGGKNEPRDARANRNGIEDLTLDQFGYDAIHRLGDHWRGRPLVNRPGAKGAQMAIDTVNNRLKTLRRFVRWLNRSDAWHWKAPDDWEHALRFRREKIMTEEEKLGQAEGPATWTDAELTTLYGYATDRDRVLLLFGLNLGFAQSEAISFRKADILRDEAPPHIRRVRRKTGKLFKASLWAETIKGLDWLAAERRSVEKADNPWVLLTERGGRPDSQHPANRWNALLDRVQKDHPDFRRLPFKHLRKTAFQLVLEASGSTEVAGTFEGRGQLSSDEQADRYGRRLFDLVFDALDQVHDRLAPMFAAAPDAFTAARPKGSSNITRSKRTRIKTLAADGVSVSEIARVVGVSRQTVYRWMSSEAGAA